MRSRYLHFAIALFILASPLQAANWTLVGWNDLGMHCTDGTDYSVFGVLPPFNTIHAQLIDSSGHLVRNATGVTVTYEAVADANGSINKSSEGKTNFWTWAKALFGADLTVNQGLGGHSMPGATNTPQPMTFDAAKNWFSAEGIPITPYDDNGVKNYYPMMKLVARDAGGTILATTSIVLPVSDEMDCRSCHASESDPAAKPYAGWVRNADPVKDVKLNILRLHDEITSGNPLFSGALAAAGYSPNGLSATVAGGTPILCAKCHSSNALSAAGYAGVGSLTHSVHHRHAGVIDPVTHLSLDSSDNRSACYRCHPGSTTKCLRGAMGNSVAADGQLAMQCQSCHGSMSTVADSARTGWLSVPACQSCHTGTATVNSGAIRFTSVFDSGGNVRTAASNVFATNVDTPAAGLSMFRFSAGHGGLQCEACHGSTHAEFPSSHANDNAQSVALQGHAGVLSDCTTCHGTSSLSFSSGPHGMHPVGQAWVSAHPDIAENNSSSCQQCHGSDGRGTVLSRSLGDRGISTKWGAKTFWRGFQVSCYACHSGPRSESGNSNHAPVVQNASAATRRNAGVLVALTATDQDNDALSLRVVNQPAHGRVGISGRTATYVPDTDFIGADTFRVAAWDGSIESNLATVTVNVATGPRVRPVRK